MYIKIDQHQPHCKVSIPAEDNGIRSLSLLRIEPIRNTNMGILRRFFFVTLSSIVSMTDRELFAQDLCLSHFLGLRTMLTSAAYVLTI